MSKNLTLEIPEQEAPRFEALLDELNDLLRRMEARSEVRDAEMARLAAENRLVLKDIRERLDHVGKAV